MRIRKTLARWLDPEATKIAARYHFMRSNLDDARWWLGSEFPDLAALAEWVLERDYWWANSKRFQERHSWSVPAHVTDIDSLRRWLREKLRRKAAAPQPRDQQAKRERSRETP